MNDVMTTDLTNPECLARIRECIAALKAKRSSREVALTITKLEEAEMWLLRHIDVTFDRDPQ